MKISEHEKDNLPSQPRFSTSHPNATKYLYGAFIIYGGRAGDSGKRHSLRLGQFRTNATVALYVAFVFRLKNYVAFVR